MIIGFLSLLVGSSGLEPPTSRLSGARSNHLSYEPISVAVFGPCLFRPSCLSTSPSPSLPPRVLPLVVRTRFGRELLGVSRGGDEQNRTVDPLLARQVLSQLSYTPIFQQVCLSWVSLLLPPL